MGWALLIALCAVLALAGRADAEPRIKVNCDIYATNHVDPIAHTDHLHHHFGNTTTTTSSTGELLFNAGSGTTSCDMNWFTTAGWFPVERYEPVRGANVYYRAPGDQTKIANIPEGLQLLGTLEHYNCNGARGKPQPFQRSPVYSCTENWGTSVRFPACWNGWSLEEDATVYGRTRSACPASNPVRLPEISVLVMHSNSDGVVPNPLTVSAGVDSWEDFSFMHADYFAANQKVFNDQLLDLCLRDAPDSVTVADPRCGVSCGS
jgi:hypothetical protein